MNSSSDQATILKQKYIDIIRDSASRAEKDGKLTKAQTGLINEQRWFKMFTPSSLGGPQLPVPEALQIQEALAAADGSTGWAVTRCALAGFSGGFLDAGVAKDIYSGDKSCIAGNSDATGTAEKTKTGYTVTGKWQHVSNANEATAFIADCIVTHNGEPVKNESNKPETITFLLLKDEVTILPAWNAMGLVATASQDFEVKNLKVPADRAFNINGASAKSNARLYQYPLLQLTEAAAAVNVSGMAFHFIAICEELFSQLKNMNGITLNNDSMVQDTYEKHLQKLNDARTKLYYAVELTWQACTNQQQIKDTILYKVSAAAHDLTKRARECVDALYPFLGLQAMDKNSEINRVWRDLHTASQDSLLVFGGM